MELSSPMVLTIVYTTNKQRITRPEFFCIVSFLFNIRFVAHTTLIRSHVALIAQLGEHCTGIAEVVGSNPAQSLNFFSGLCSSSVTAALALMTVIIRHTFVV